MVKRIAACLTLLCVMISSSACSKYLWGTFHETSVENYGEWKKFLGEWAEYVEIPSFLPSSVKDYTVNSYSYKVGRGFELYYEVFLDITVEEEEFESLLEKARAYSDTYEEQEAVYCDGYTEIVFEDYYERREGSGTVGWADIQKVIYNPDTNNIVYAVLSNIETGVYDVKDVAYFNRFSIEPENYPYVKTE